MGWGLAEVKVRARVISPRPGREGSLEAYCQLLIQAIQMRILTGRQVGKGCGGVEICCRIDPVDSGGCRVPHEQDDILVLGGGTGVAPILLAAMKWPKNIIKAFFGFSHTIYESFVFQKLNA